MGGRIADVAAPPDLVLELQHSRITRAEVDARNRDYAGVGKSVVWLVDGTPVGCDVEVVPRHDGASVLTFAHLWPTDAFASCAVMLVHTASGVFSIDPSAIRFGMTVASPPWAVADFVCMVRDPMRHGELRAARHPVAANTLTVLQDPPGSGKTWKLVNLALNPEAFPAFAHIDQYLYLTKPHSAKRVVAKELEDNARRFGHPVIERLDTGKALLYTVDVSGRQVQVICATIDSFIWRLQNPASPAEAGEFDMFVRMCLGITALGVGPLSRTGTVPFHGKAVSIGPKTLVCFDEATKPRTEYAQALLRIAATANCSVVVAGDKLQSIESPSNCMSAIRQLPASMMRVHCVEGNTIRRFGPVLVDFLVTVLGPETYSKHGLTVPEPTRELGIAEGDGVVVVEKMPRIQQDTPMDDQLITDTVQRIMSAVQADTDALSLLPQHVMCVLPTVKCNPLADALTNALHEFWARKLADCRYRAQLAASPFAEQATALFGAYDAGQVLWLSVFHRSEGGRPIDTSTSDLATRLVSIHASQGDGRRLVVVLQLSEFRLKLHTRSSLDPTQLQYDSLLNVALSRAKTKLRVFIEGGDDVHRRVAPFLCAAEAPAPVYRVPAGHRQLQPANWPVDALEALQLAVREQSASRQEAPPRAAPPLVDHVHHTIRRACMHVVLHIKLLLQYGGPEAPIFQLLQKVAGKRLRLCDDTQQYVQLLTPNRGEFVLMRYSRWEATCRQIESSFHRLQGFLEELLTSKAWARDSPTSPLWHEYVLMWHLLDVHEKGRWTGVPLTVVYEVFKSVESTGSLAGIQQHYHATLGAVDAVCDRLVALHSGKWLFQHKLALERGVVDPVGSGGEGAPTPEFHFSTALPFVCEAADSMMAVVLVPAVNDMFIEEMLHHLIPAVLTMTQPASGTGKNAQRFGRHKAHWVLFQSTSDTASVKLEIRPEWFAKSVDALIDSIRAVCQREHPNIRRFVAHYADPVSECERLPDAEKMAGYVLEELRAVADVEEDCGEQLPDCEVGRILDRKLQRALDTFHAAVIPRSNVAKRLRATQKVGI
jgi:hypothetical protein